ncbi:MAG: nucleotide exchange factor GrpE [Balneolaceae bacterium]
MSNEENRNLKEETETTLEASGSEKHEESNLSDMDQEMNRESGEDSLILEQQKRIAELERQLDEMKNAHLRKVAELENIKKRIQRDKAQLFDSARIAAIEEFLPVNDDLQRTIKALEESTESDSGMLDGIRMIGKKFDDVLKRFQVERIDEAGVPFDVDLHDALLRQKPDDDQTGSDIVLQVVENGYRMGDRTIRHAKVIVSE